jgi:hypothetical protein
MILVSGSSLPIISDPNTHSKMVVDTPFKRFYEEHVTMLDAHDFENLVKTHYHPEGQIVSAEYLVRGHGEMFKHFAKYTGLMAYLKVISTDRWIEGEQTFAFEATARTQWGVGKVHDAFVMRDGLIIRHFTGSIPLIRFAR